MDKKLFSENLLTKNLSENIVKQIEKIDSSINPEFFENIINSDEMGLFIASLKVPKYVAETNFSVLLQNMKTSETLKTLKTKYNKKQNKKKAKWIEIEISKRDKTLISKTNKLNGINNEK